MVTFPGCKINLGLHVLARRADGYHDIETCFYPVPWNDMLEIIPAAELQFSFSGTAVGGSPDDNLCVRAYIMLREELRIPPVHLHLHKIIPAGAGLGGGSSDAAATLILLNDLFSLGLGRDTLRAYGNRLGSDVPFFIESAPSLATGKGEILSPLALNLAGKFLAIVCPAIHSSTAEAYRHVTPKPSANSLAKALGSPVTRWKDTLLNDFEPYVFGKYPELAAIRERLYQRGALFAAMSGSGSSVFGLFDDAPASITEFAGMQVWSGVLSQ